MFASHEQYLILKNHIKEKELKDRGSEAGKRKERKKRN